MDERQVPVLLVKAGPGAGRILPLTGEKLVLGRDPTCGLPFDIKGVSREHCVFLHDEAGWNVADLKSTNGTRLNDKPLGDEAIILSEGDRIQAGTVELEFGFDRGGADRLRVVQGPLAGRALPLRGALAILGRSAEDTDISLDDGAASRQNTELRFADGVWTVRDLGSRNGTDYDGARLPPEVAIPLHSGARLRAGSTTFDFLDRRVEDLANHTLLGYHLEERVAAGPGAVIYRGRGDDGEAVAMRLLDPNRCSDPTAVARFIAAGRAQMRLQHERLVATFAAETVDQLSVAISSWVDDGCLATRLAAGRPIPIDLVQAWAVDLAEGLLALEELGQAHRGLRPSNCLVGKDGRLRLSDVCTATAFDPTMPHGPVPPHYLAPEEIDGSEPTARGNQFSLGCILHHALSGKTPFGAPDRSQVATARRSESLCAIDGLSPDWTKVLTRLLARAPEDRYPGWQEALVDLEALARARTPSTGLLSAGRSALAGRSQTAASGRASTRAVSRGSTRAETVAAPPPPPANRVVIPPWSIKAAVALIIILILIGFVLPALNQSKRAEQQTQPPPAPTPQQQAPPPRPMPQPPRPIRAPEPTPSAAPTDTEL